MYKRIKERWIKALRSGEYKQTTGTLREREVTRDEDYNPIPGTVKYCCLGVLTDLYCKTKKIDFYNKFGGEDILPDEVAKWAGIKEDVFGGGEVIVGNLKLGGDNPEKAKDPLHFTQLNDTRKYSFKKIAGYVEKYL